MTRSIVPVVLSGGSGTRLWPLSRELHPKQFLSLVGERTLFQETVLRTRPLTDRLEPPIIVCNENHRFLVAEQLRRIGVSPRAIVLEPVGRNTAPAVAIAAWLAVKDVAADAAATSDDERDPLLLVMPADHVIADTDAFARAATVAFDAAAEGYLTTFGIVPDRPESGYGYIRRGAPGPAGNWYLLDAFVEKPDIETARRYVSAGDYLWNSGMFVFSARRYLDELERHAPEIAAACRAAASRLAVGEDFTRLGDEFRDCPSDSIDYAVMEKTDRAAVVPLDAGWSDVGSWPALHAVLPRDGEGNVLRGDVVAHACRNSYISAESRLVAAVGVEGHVIVETADAVLVIQQDMAQDVKRIVDALKEAGRAEIKSHSDRS